MFFLNVNIACLYFIFIFADDKFVRSDEIQVNLNKIFLPLYLEKICALFYS